MHAPIVTPAGTPWHRISVQEYGPPMEIAEHIDVLDDEGRRFLDAATTAGLGTAVPRCPGWAAVDLMRHLGGVHRWATKVVAERLTAPEQARALYDVEQSNAPHDDVAQWFAEGHAALVEALRGGSADDDFWRFSRVAPSSLAFWARRQAHETAIHRVDADEAGRAAGAPFAARFAADGIDELFEVFVSRRREPIEPEQTFLAVADDVDRRWHITLGASGVVPITQPDAVPGGADMSVSGSADALYRLLWNRLDETSPQIHVAGDLSVLTTWQATVAVD
jgi:uncharacterized protein (TIGR03083 family)